MHNFQTNSSVEQVLEEVLGRLEALESLTGEIRQAVSGSLPKREAYSTKEVAEILGRKPFTVREWCRLGRVNAFKTDSGRGADDEWRISQDELLRIQNEGLLGTRQF